MREERLPSGALFVDLSDIDEKCIVVKWPNNLSAPTIINNGSVHLVSDRPRVVIQQVEVSYKKKKIKINYKKQDIGTGDDYRKIDPADWKPRQLLQYVKKLYTDHYGKLPLELKWSDFGYTDNAIERSRCWGRGKSIIDKFERMGKRGEVKKYIQWVFENKKTRPTMPLLACSQFIDDYIFSKLDKKDIIASDPETDSNKWNRIVRKLSK